MMALLEQLDRVPPITLGQWLVCVLPFIIGCETTRAFVAPALRRRLLRRRV